MKKISKIILIKSKKTALVTGGAGFIGSNLVDELVKKGWCVRVIDNLSTGKRENLNPKADFYKRDIRNLKAIKPYFKGVDYVFHMAALARVQPSIIDPVTSHDINLNGMLNVLLAARDSKVKKFVYSASSSAYGDQEQLLLRENLVPRPGSPYALQKYIGELYCKLFSKIYGLPTVCLRYFNVYGERQILEGAYAAVIGIFLKQRLNKRPMTITGDGQNRRDYTYVKDVIRANILAAQSNLKCGEVINIGCGQNHSLLDVAELIGGPYVFITPRIEPKVTLADNSLAKKLLGWMPETDLSDWIKRHKKEIGLD